MYCWPTSLRYVVHQYGLTRLRLDGPLLCEAHAGYRRLGAAPAGAGS